MLGAFWLGLVALVFIIAIITAIIAKDPDFKMGAVVTSVIAGIVGVISGFFLMFNSVGATEVGVPVSFGQVGEPLQPGVHFVAPWTDIETYPTRPVTVELSGDNRILARTADAGQMTVEVAARWQVNAEQAKTLYLQVRTGDDERISNDVVTKNLRQAVGVVYSGITNQAAINDRAKVALLIQDQLQQQLDTYGIKVVDINMRSVEPDERTATTLAAYASQQQATKIATEAKNTAKIEAERRLIEAKGIQDAADAVSGITDAEAQVVCMQVWQQTVAKAIEAGVPVYTTPCGSGNAVPVVGTSAPKAAAE